ncbi:MAG TPA: STAS domain-containing protein [Polyangiaceae bacterium]|nr:STAS domain-containing protein [Polyangiaceae bacterium]
MAEGRVLYADNEDVHVLRYMGDIRHPLAPSISAFVDDLLDRMGPGDLVFDLSAAEAIDSTNLGELARIANLLQTHTGKRAIIAAPRPEVLRVLCSMAFDEVFHISSDPPASEGGEPIPAVSVAADASLHLILNAHRRLMQMNEKNRDQFSEVVELMETEITNGDRRP